MGVERRWEEGRKLIKPRPITHSIQSKEYLNVSGEKTNKVGGTTVMNKSNVLLILEIHLHLII